MKYDKLSIRKRDLAQIGRDVIRDRDYTIKQANEAIDLISALEEEWSNKIARQLEARLRRLGGIDMDIMEMMLIPDSRKGKDEE